MKKIPDYVLTNTETYSRRAFKSQKRQQVRAALKAIDDLRAGCAFLPSGSKSVEIAANALKAVQDECSIKNWGR